ncbi:complement C1q-like protein 2 [Engraulis encrasicolus]|uniref:complement C1q-like protein 2 n=1 Tax=Engraulis encrasicolus TaxID=184585 RepID=UPI002FD42E1C
MRAAISLLVLLLSMCGVQTDVSTELKELRDMLVALEAENKAVKERLTVSEGKVEALETEIRAAPKVAFSTALKEIGLGYIESGNTDLNLVFKKVITNVGEGYSSWTGIFTAPVKGVYYFRFTVMDLLFSRDTYIKMYKNGQQLMELYEEDIDGHPTYLSSGLALQLEKGDTVNLVLPAGNKVYDNSDNNHCTFSGFLLFPL